MRPKTPFFSRWIKNRYKKLFWLFFIITFILAYIQILQNKELTNTTADNGIISLELGSKFSYDSAIIWSWKPALEKADSNNITEKKSIETNLNLARSNIFIDLFFIVCYLGLGIVIICYLHDSVRITSVRFTNTLIILLVVAGLMDYIEDVGMLQFIHYGMYPGDHIPRFTAWYTSRAALFKFIILGFLALGYLPYMLITHKQGLQKLSGLLERKIEQLYRYRVIFMGVIGFVLPMWVLDQGQDLLVNSNASEWGAIALLDAIMTAALINWYLAKLFFIKVYKGPVYPFTEPSFTNKHQIEGEKKVSRFLGVSTILLPAAAIVHAMDVTHVPRPLPYIPPFSLLTGSLILFYLLIRDDTVTNIYRRLETPSNKNRLLVYVIALLLLLSVGVPLILRWWNREVIRQPASLLYLYWDLISLAFAFYIFTSLRTLVFPENGWLGRRIGIPVFVLAQVCTLFFLYINIRPLTLTAWENIYITLPLMLAGVVFYIFLVTILIRLSQLHKINFLFFIVALGLIVSVSAVNNYHNVVTRRGVSETRQQELGDYFKAWLEKRKDEIRDSVTYPVFLVNTYGGGIRAAAFTSMVLTYLDSALAVVWPEKKGFGHYAFSVSGASGGTIGAAIHCAYRYRYKDNPNAYKQGALLKFYSQDFLTPVLIPDLGRDIWASATGTNLWNDRSAIQEAAWDSFAHRKFDLDLGLEYDSIWRLKKDSTDYEVPLLFSNTLNVDDGLKGICSPVHLQKDDFPGTIFIRERIDSMNVHRGVGDSTGISLITGAFLSARFPFMSPSGKMGPGFHFMDGGGKDNSGASTSELIFQALARYCDSVIQNNSHDDSLFIHLIKNIRFCFVSISNSPQKKTDRRELVDNRFELISPLVGIINSGIDGNAHAADSTLQARYSNQSTKHSDFFTAYYSIYPTVDEIEDSQKKDPYVPVLPLGWQISEPALRRLEASFTKNAVKASGRKGLNGIVNDLYRRNNN